MKNLLLGGDKNEEDMAFNDYSHLIEMTPRTPFDNEGKAKEEKK
jgi:hypothetical protein